MTALDDTVASCAPCAVEAVRLWAHALSLQLRPILEPADVCAPLLDEVVGTGTGVRVTRLRALRQAFLSHVLAMLPSPPSSERPEQVNPPKYVLLRSSSSEEW